MRQQFVQCPTMRRGGLLTIEIPVLPVA